jgi:hypothetical protein
VTAPVLVPVIAPIRPPAAAVLDVEAALAVPVA